MSRERVDARALTVEETRDHRVAILGGCDFRMELDPDHGMLTMLERHHRAVVVSVAITRKSDGIVPGAITSE
jgi:hypothetical protein